MSDSNDSPLHPNLSSTNTNLPLGIYCLLDRPNSVIYTVFFSISILLMFTLSVLILYLGVSQWWRQRSNATAASHSDCFTYHLAVMELIGVLGCSLYYCGIYRFDVGTLTVGPILWTFTWFGETFFNLLTCVERYLAVVHPIIYLGLRRERGIRIRNISIGCVWLLSMGGAGLMRSERVFLDISLSLLIVSIVIISFCSLCVLFVLFRPRPGHQGGDRAKVDSSKLRAFYTIVAILGVLLMRCSSNLVWSVVNVSNGGNVCLMMTSTVWFNLPCSVLLPVLFLQRRTPACCRNPNKD